MRDLPVFRNFSTFLEVIRKIALRRVLILCEQEELKGDAGAVWSVRFHVEHILTSTIGILWRT